MKIAIEPYERNKAQIIGMMATAKVEVSEKEKQLSLLKDFYNEVDNTLSGVMETTSAKKVAIVGSIRPNKNSRFSKSYAQGTSTLCDTTHSKVKVSLEQLLTRIRNAILSLRNEIVVIEGQIAKYQQIISNIEEDIRKAKEVNEKSHIK